jgi:TonB family protein
MASTIPVRIRRTAYRRWQRVTAIAAPGIAALALVALATGLLRHPKAGPAGQVSPPATLGLRAGRYGRNLLLSWNRVTVANSEASHGILYIEDGTYKTQLELDKQQLNTGKLTYYPESTEVRFRLEVTSQAGIAAESLQWNGSVLAVGERHPSPFAKVKPDAPPRRERAKEAEADIAQALSGQDPAWPSRPPVRQMQESADRTMPADPIPPPPLLTANLTAAAPPPGLIPSLPPQHSVSVRVEPAAGSWFSRVAGRIPIVRRLRKDPAGFVPPRPLSEVRPEMSALDRQYAAADVGVRLSLNESGRVDYAEVISGGADRALASAALIAARQWRFVPAELDGEKVASEIILRFHFQPELTANTR